MKFNTFDRERWNRMTEQEQIEETERCNNDPLYFYNNYFLPEGGKPITQEEFDSLIESRDAIMLKGRSNRDLILHPVTPDQAFKLEFEDPRNIPVVKDIRGIEFDIPNVMYIMKNPI